MIESVYIGMMESLIVEVSKDIIADRLSHNGRILLPRIVYDDARMLVDAFFVLLQEKYEIENNH